MSIPATKLATATVSAWQRQFLNDEERATASLQAFFGEARSELEEFIRSGPLTKADRAFYSGLLQQVAARESQLLAGAKSWVDQTIPKAYVTGAQTHHPDVRFDVVNDDAVKALSRGTMDLITKTTIDMRLALQQQIAQGLLQGLSGQDIRNRLLQSGLTNIPHWPSADYRAGVIARTETMRAYNDGAFDAIERTGAKFVRWIASPDEAVCGICAPRNHQVYRIGKAGTRVTDEASGHQFVSELVQRYGVKAKLKVDPNVGGAFANGVDLITLSTQALEQGAMQANFHVDSSPTGVITHEYAHLVQAKIGKPAREIAKAAWQDPPSARAHEKGSTLVGPNAEAFAEAFTAYHLQGVDRWGMQDLLKRELGDQAVLDAGGTRDPYPRAIPLPSKPPAHPRCRCTIRAEYRDANGKLIDGADEQAPAEPAPEPEPELPPAVGDPRSAIDRLGSGEIGSAFDRRLLPGAPKFTDHPDVAFWRNFGELDDDMMRAIAGKGPGAFGEFTLARYGISFAPQSRMIGGKLVFEGAIRDWDAELFRAALRSFEAVRAAVPRYMVDSNYFTVFGKAPAAANPFSYGTIARCFASGEIEMNSTWRSFVRNERPLRAGDGADGGMEVLIHEIGHSVQNRYGVHAKFGYIGSEYGVEYRRGIDNLAELLKDDAWRDRYLLGFEKSEEFDKAWAAVRRKSSGMGVAPLNAADDPAIAIQKKIDAFETMYGYQTVVEKLRKQLADLAKVESGQKDLFPTDYAKSDGAKEDFAESFMLYMLNPRKLKRFSRNRYEFMRTKVFEGKEF